MISRTAQYQVSGTSGGLKTEGCLQINFNAKNVHFDCHPQSTLGKMKQLTLPRISQVVRDFSSSREHGLEQRLPRLCQELLLYELEMKFSTKKNKIKDHGIINNETLSEEFTTDARLAQRFVRPLTQFFVVLFWQTGSFLFLHAHEKMNC